MTSLSLQQRRCHSTRKTSKSNHPLRFLPLLSSTSQIFDRAPFSKLWQQMHNIKPILTTPVSHTVQEQPKWEYNRTRISHNKHRIIARAFEKQESPFSNESGMSWTKREILGLVQYGSGKTVD